jgi:DCC-interacting protein 13 alpha
LYRLLQTALHYFALLNTLQYKRKSALLEPLIGIMQAQKTFFEMGHEATSRSEVNEFVANIGASVQGFVSFFYF